MSPVIARQEDLEFSGFSCCGDEDLHPFQCALDCMCMVFCHDCGFLRNFVENRAASPED